ncbi:DUF5305 family protein [Paenibacillus sp. MBLB4367]|uniref:DUF5305 family protein n=1 Tax=Paenibacillus sp. MBLB4367 TaxID=3384767 RepID=UPI0039080362
MINLQKLPRLNGLRIKRKILLTVLGISTLFLSILSVQAFLKPAVQVRKTVENQINSNVRLDYKAEVTASALYPKNEIITPDMVIFARITKSVPVNINYALKAQKDIAVSGSYRVLMTLTADQMWQKEYELKGKTLFEATGKELQVVQDSISINLESMIDFIARVEKETQLKPQKYTIKIKPLLDGQIKYEDRTFPVDQSPELNFEYVNNYLKMIGNKEYAKEYAAEKTSSTPQSLEVLGAAISIPLARSIFPAGALLLSALLGGLVVMRRKQGDGGSSESAAIDKKLAKRLIHLAEFSLPEENRFIRLQSFDMLLQMAEEKELPLLRLQESDEEVVTYFILDGSCMYGYKAMGNLQSASQPA